MSVLVVYFVFILSSILLLMLVAWIIKSWKSKKKPVIRILKGYGEFFDQHEKKILEHKKSHNDIFS